MLCDIYLDSDIIVHSDIQELWQEAVGKNGLAAIPESVITYGHMLDKDICRDGFVQMSDYFNSGVLLIDMEAYRRHSHLLEDGLAFLAAHSTYRCYDQDILNYVFSTGYRPLPLRYNTFVAAERLYGTQKIRPATFYHYAGLAFQFWDGTDAFNRLFCHYYQRTPWYEDAQLLFACQDAAAAALRLCLSICKRAGGRRIDFCGSQAELPVVQQELAFFPGALFTDVTTEDGRINLPFLQQEMKRLQEEAPTLFVFVEPRFSEWHHWLSGDGFQFGRDYVDGTLLVQLLQHSSCRVLTQVFGRLGMLPVDKSAAKP